MKAMKFNKNFLIRNEGIDKWLLYNHRTHNCLLTNDLGLEIIKIFNSDEANPKSIKNLCDTKLYNEFINMLMTAGVLISEDQNFNQKYINLEGFLPSQEIELKSPIKITWLITYRCNLSCKHCYLSCSPKRAEYELSTSQILSVIKMLADCGVMLIDYSGGEPLMRKDIFNIFHETVDSGMKFALVTNGLLLTKEKIEKLIKLDVSAVQISLDGVRKETHEFLRGPNTFDKTIEVIKELVKSDVYTGITFTYGKFNFKEIPEMIKLAKALGVKSIRFGALNAWGRAAQELNNQILSESEKVLVNKLIYNLSKNYIDEISITIDRFPGQGGNLYSCQLAMSLCIAPNGIVYPCDIFAGANELSLGNVLMNSIVDIWHSNKAIEIRERAKIVNKGHCNSCQYLSACGSWCMAELFWSTGRLFPPQSYFERCKNLWNSINHDFNWLEVL